MSKQKLGIIAGSIVFALSVIATPVLGACSLQTLSECDNTGLMALIVQLLGGQTGTGTGTGTITGIPAGFQFTTNLKLGSTGTDVKYLQILLNSDPATAVGNAGNETTYFGTLTRAAVIKFQNKYASVVLAPYGLSAGTGNFAVASRTKANALIASGAGTGTGTGTTPVTGLNVTLASTNPTAAFLAKGAVATPVVAYTISSQTATTLDSVKFTRTGLGLPGDYSSVYIYSNGMRLKSGRTISSDSQTVEFTNIGLAIPANTLVDLTVRVDVSATATENDVSTLGIASASDIKFIGGAIPTGIFPLRGNNMTISAITIGTATVAPGSVPSSPTIGAMAALVGNIKITAGSDDITLDRVTFTQNGTLSSSLLGNITLKLGSTVLATTASMTGDKVTLVLSTPYAIGKVNNKTFGIYADINGGKRSDTIRFYVDEDSDIQITDTKYNQGADVTNTFTAAHASYVSALQGGEITLTDKGPAANTIARNINDVELLKFGVVTSRNVTVKDYTITLDDATNKANTTVNGDTDTFVVGTSGTLTVTSSTGFEVNDYIIVGTTTYAPATDMIAKITAIVGNDLTITPVQGTNLTVANADIVSTVVKITATRLVNADTGSVLYSSSTNRYFYNGATAVSIAASDDFDLNIGTAYNLSVRVDISDYSAPGMQIIGGIDLSTASTIKDYDANEYVLAANIVPNVITGKTMTVAAPGLTISRSSTPVSVTKVLGTQGVDTLGISMASGSTSDTKVTQMIVRFLADTTTTFGNGTGDTAANTIVDSASLYDGTTQIAGPKSLASASWVADTAGTYYKATFDNMAFTIPAGTTKKVTVKVNLKSTGLVTHYLVATLAPADDITAQDSDGNTLTIANTADGGVNENDSSTTVQDDTIPPVQIAVTTAGVLSLKGEGSPSTAIVAAGSADVVMSKYKLSSTNESYILDKLTVAADTGVADFATAESTYDHDITQVGLRFNGGTVIKTSLSGGLANFQNLNVTVPADGYVYIEVLADFNTIAGGAVTGDTPRLGIYQAQATANTFRATGSGSSTTANYTTTLATTVTGEENIYAMTVRKTFPTVAKVAGGPTLLANGSNQLYSFTVSADAKEAVSLKRFTLTITGSNAALGVTALKLYRGITDISDKVLIYKEGAGNGSMEAAVDLVADANANSIYFIWDGTTEEIIPAGSTYTYTVSAAVTGVIAGYSISSYIADDVAVLTTTTGVLAIGGYNATTGYIYDAAGTTVAANDIRITSASKYTTVDVVAAADVTGHNSSAKITEAYGITGDVTLTLPEWTTDNVINGATFTVTGAGATGLTCTPYTGVAQTGAVTTQVTLFSAIQSVGCTGTGMSLKINAITVAVDTGANTSNPGLVIVITKATDYASGSVVAATDSDFGNSVTAASTTHNFVWSDNSNTSHNVVTGSDWTNGFLVDSLPTSLQALTGQ